MICNNKIKYVLLYLEDYYIKWLNYATVLCSYELLSNLAIYYFSVGIQRRRLGFNSHISRTISRYCLGNIMGKRFANDFDAHPVQRDNTPWLVILSDIELCIVGLIFIVVAKLSIFAKID